MKSFIEINSESDIPERWGAGPTVADNPRLAAGAGCRYPDFDGVKSVTRALQITVGEAKMLCHCGMVKWYHGWL